MSTNTVAIVLSSDDDSRVADYVRDFLSPFGQIEVSHNPPRAGKSWDAAITLILTIGAGWAAERYVLNPLADRREEWLRCVTSTWSVAGSRRPLSVIVRYGVNPEVFSIETNGVTSVAVLGRLWRRVADINQARQSLLLAGIPFSKVRIVSATQAEELVIGYQGGKPTHLLDLEAKTARPIRSDRGEDDLEVDAHIWYVATLITSVQYHEFLISTGRRDLEAKYQELLQEIAKEIAKL